MEMIRNHVRPGKSHMILGLGSHPDGPFQSIMTALESDANCFVILLCTRYPSTHYGFLLRRSGLNPPRLADTLALVDCCGVCGTLSLKDIFSEIVTLIQGKDNYKAVVVIDDMLVCSGAIVFVPHLSLFHL